MKNLNYIFILLFFFLVDTGFSQCGPLTPSFTVNLVGAPNGTYTSPLVQRDDLCCGATNPDRCLKFTIYLDPSAAGINFEIASGAVPPGALFYQINCGPPIAVGSPICLAGPGPHILTFCKPGNNNNTYAISSFPGPAVPDSVMVRSGCTVTLAVTGFSVPTINWNSIAPGAPGAYNSYLSCVSGCATVAVTPTGTPPAFVDYKVSGFAAAPCQANFHEDTVRVYFYSDLLAAINPTSATICFGQSNAVLTATASGGLPAYSYTWNTGSNSQSIAVGPGNYTVQVNDNTGCPPTTATAVVNSFTLPISANAGPDQTRCKTNPNATLNGTVVMASGGMWSGGTGTYSPSQASNNITYIPTLAELATGSVQLTFSTTGNSGCPPGSDNVIIFYQNAPVANAGPNATVCANNSAASLAGTITGYPATPVWSSSGSGVFSSTTNLSTTYTPSAAEIGAGIANITLSTANNGVCPPANSTVQVIITPAPVVNAGPSQTICSTGPAALSGSVTGPTSTGMWSSSGSGTFTPSPGALNATYQPSASDIANGTITLTLTSTGNGNCLPVSSSMVITIIKIATVTAGPSQTLCSSSGSIALSGTVSGGSGSGNWGTNGSGTFNPGAAFLNTNYSFSAADIAAGSRVFTLSSTNNGPCPAVSSTLSLVIIQPAVVNAGPNQAICSNAGTIGLSGSVSTGAGIWSSNGSGSYNPNNAVLNPAYAFSAADIAAASVIFTLSSANNGPCPVVQDTVQMVIKGLATVTAGPSQSVCATTGSINLSGSISGGSNSGIWTTNGTGSFNPAANSLNTSYMLSAADIAAGFRSFTLSSTNNGPCPAVSSTLSLTIFQLAVVNAGTNQAICSNAGTISLSGTVSTGTGIWSSNGGGSYNPNNTVPNPTYAITAADIAAASVIFTLSSANNGPCPVVQDTVKMVIKGLATVTAGPSQTICSTSGSINLNGSVGGGSSTGAWTTDGTGSFNPGAASLNASYFISAADIAAGVRNFTLSSTNNGPCPVVSSTLSLTIFQLAIVNAGPNQALCSNAGTIALNGSVNTNFGIWSSSGSGTYSPHNAALNTIYAITPSDILAGSVTFTLSSANNGPCPIVRDSVKMSIKTLAVVNAGINQAICSSTGTVSLSGTINGGTNSGLWGTNGNGAFNPGANSLNNIYFVSVSDISLGALIFTLTSQNNAPCPAVADTMMLRIFQPASVNSGPNQALCSNTGTLGLTGSISSLSNTGTWSSTGTGTFIPDQSNLSPTYSISASDISVGFVIFTLTSTNNGACPPVSDSVKIIIRKMPLVNAGPDKVICSTSTSVPVSGSVGGGSSTGLWSHNGSGNISPNNTSLNMTYGVSQQDINAGLVSIVLVSTNNGVCPAVRDTVQIIIKKNPNIRLSADTTICSYQNPLKINPILSGDFGPISWTSSGSGNFIPNNAASPVWYNLTNDIAAGVVHLSIATLSNGPCASINGSIKVTIRPSPNAGFTASTYTANIPNDPITFYNQSGNASTYQWNFGDGGSSTIKNPIHNYQTVGYYTVSLVASNIYGCRDTATRDILVISDIQFPNVFTPNPSGSNGGTYSHNDYSNDVFFPYTSGVTEYNLKIFNRWGELIFESNDLRIGWDGYFKDKLCQQDGYVWKADIKFFDGRKYNKTGSVTLLR